MSRSFVLNISAVATSIRPLLTTTAAFRRLAKPPQFTSINRTLPRTFTTTKVQSFTQSSCKMTVHNIQGAKEYQELLEQSKGKLILLDCFATWCGPCKAIAPVVSKLSEEYSDVGFYKVDVDESPDVAQELGVRAMPTFMFFKDGEKVGEVVGADPNKIQQQLVALK